MEALLAKHGLRLGKLSASVDAVAGTVRLALNLADADLTTKDGTATTPEIERWKRYAAMFQMDPAWLGKTVPGAGRIIGLRDTRGAKCVLFEKQGKTYITTPDDLRRRMAPLKAPQSEELAGIKTVADRI